jgi:hypothetical protein
MSYPSPPRYDFVQPPPAAMTREPARRPSPTPSEERALYPEEHAQEAQKPSSFPFVRWTRQRWLIKSPLFRRQEESHHAGGHCPSCGVHGLQEADHPLARAGGELDAPDAWRVPDPHWHPGRSVHSTRELLTILCFILALNFRCSCSATSLSC